MVGEKMTQTYQLTAPYMTLGQFLKEIAEISSGGEAKWYLQEYDVFVNGELERRRGRKLYADALVTLPNGDVYQFVGE